MTDHIAAPLIRDDSGDVEVFATVESLLANTETIDIRNGAYEVFDARGRRLDLRVDEDSVLGIIAAESPVLDPVGSERRDEPELRRRLVGFLVRVGYRPGDLSKATVEELIGLCPRGDENSR